MRVTDLVFEPHENEFLLVECATARLDNGILVSVIQGPHVWTAWRPGLFEAAVIEPNGLLDDPLRGDAATIDAWLARLEQTEKGPAS
jgi:hypothetical protein